MVMRFDLSLSMLQLLRCRLLKNMLPDQHPHRSIATSQPKIPEATATVFTNSSSSSWADEQCILVDTDDRVIGSASKLACHKRANIEQRGLLHRAFSVFLFDNNDNKSGSGARLLMQQRAATKPTFAGMFTNTCCSHPLMHAAGHHQHRMNDANELDERNLHVGIKRAARRRLQQELGIENFPLHELFLVSKVHYQAVDDHNHSDSDAGGEFGEHEIDYILLAQVPSSRAAAKYNCDISKIKPNPSEVSWHGWMSQNEISDLVRGRNDDDSDDHRRVTPWFRFIAEKWLLNNSSNNTDDNNSCWWNQLNNLAQLERQYDGSILRAGILQSYTIANQHSKMESKQRQSMH